uniref:PAPA-1 domain-containing protein n=1 Tax=Heterorhabditis bacteriophora TaxID=37862 RepID=A0A1I7W679_HETBA
MKKSCVGIVTRTSGELLCAGVIVTMDFTSLLDTAVKNTKNISKTLNDLDSEVVKERKSQLKRLEAEKKAKLELMKKRGTMSKGESEQSERQKLAEKEKLIQLRLQANGGKAIFETPKLVKQPHRIATSKANSLMGLSSRHAQSRDNFSPPPEYSKSKTTGTVSEIKKKRRHQQSLILSGYIIDLMYVPFQYYVYFF